MYCFLNVYADVYYVISTRNYPWKSSCVKLPLKNLESDKRRDPAHYTHTHTHTHTYIYIHTHVHIKRD